MPVHDPAIYPEFMATSAQSHPSHLSIDPEQLQVIESYKLMTGLIVPRPVALVSPVDANGVRNLAPYSFFAGVGANPPTVLFCPSLTLPPPAPTPDRPDDRKDSLRNVEQTGEFVINIVSEAIAHAANLSAASVPPSVDEFELAGLTPIPSEVVRAPRVAESPAQLECKLIQIVFTGEGQAAGVLVLGRIVRFHIRPDLIDNFRIDPERLDAVGRMAGSTWSTTRDRFDLVRPK